MVKLRGPGGAVAAIVVVGLLTYTAVFHPEYADLLLVAAEAAGIEVIPPAGIIPDLANFAQLEGPVGEWATHGIVFVGTFATVAGLDRLR